MSTIRIQGADLAYEESSIITFAEGLIGLPRLRRMVLVRQTDIEPFMWLASLDDPAVAFLVVDPRELFHDYALPAMGQLAAHLDLDEGEAPLVLTIVTVAPEWAESTANLRAPLLISASSMRGAQSVLADTAYRVAERLPLAHAA